MACAWALDVDAIGPRNITTDGLPVRWTSMPLTVDVESDLTVRGKDVSGLVSDALNAWVSLEESSVTITQNSLGVAVDEVNVCDYFVDSSECGSSALNDGTNPLVIDEDGEITAAFFGAGNKFTTLGFASIVSFNDDTGAALKGEAVFNASCLNGVEVAGCALTAPALSFSDDDFTSFIVHEIGHFLGLDHSQVNLEAATDDDDSNDNLITTMFPTFIIGNGDNFKTPARDDQVGLAQLYPNSLFTSSTWTLTGTVFDTDGDTELQCANLVARNISDPFVDAIAALSGDFADAGDENGEYEIPGLTLGATYSLEVEPIASGFTGSSGYTPCRGASGDPSPPSFDTITSTHSYTESTATTLVVDCTVESDCTSGAVDAGGSSGGCALIR